MALIDVKIVEGSVESHEEFELNRIIAFDPDCSLRIFLGLKAHLLKAELKIWVDTESEPSQAEAHGHFHFHFIYHVKALDQWIHEMENGDTNMDPGLQNAVASVSYSTARGILISRFQGTVFQRFVLPIINPNDLLEQSSKSKPRVSPRKK